MCVMWRFMLISFGLLGFAFYELSGGADYAPSPNSLQVAWADKSIFAVPDRARAQDTQLVAVTIPDVDEAAAQIEATQSDATRNAVTEALAAALKESEADEQVARADTTLTSFNLDHLGQVNVTLAGAAQDTTQANTLGLTGLGLTELGLSGVGAFSADTLVADVRAIPLDQALPAMPADIRSVLRNSANMRAGPGTDYETVEQLPLGAPVQVLDEASGWLRLRDLETGQTGWMADWLITASN